MTGGRYSLPPEIRKFILTEQPASLVVKGFPGCGKTIFSLECISEFSNLYAGYYVSTRVDARSLYAQFPWLRKHVPKINVIDATHGFFPKKIDIAHSLEYASLPDFLKGLYLILKEGIQERKPMIVVDSIEALLSVSKLPLDELCPTLIDFSKELNAKLLLVTENHGVTLADYIVDGVIRFEKELVNGRLLRKMIIEKLRGIEVSNPIYYFTLNDGRFHYFEKFPFYDWISAFQESHKPILDGKGTEFEKLGKFSSGSPMFDKIFGGFKRGSLVLFEADTKIPPETVLTVTSVTPENFMTQNRAVLMIPPGSLHPEYVVKLYQCFVGKSVVSRYFREFQFADSAGARDNIIVIREHKPLRAVRELINVIDEFIDICNNRTFLLYVSIDTLESIYGKRGAMKILSELAAKVQMENSLCISLKFTNGDEMCEYRKIADMVIRIFSMNGVVFLYGVKPATPIYNVNIDLSLKHPRLVLMSIT